VPALSDAVDHAAARSLPKKAHASILSRMKDAQDAQHSSGDAASSSGTGAPKRVYVPTYL